MPGFTESSSSVSNGNSDDFGNVTLVCMVSFSACASYSHRTHNLVAVVGPLSIGKRELSEGLNNRSKSCYLLPWRCDFLPNQYCRDSRLGMSALGSLADIAARKL